MTRYDSHIMVQVAQMYYMDGMIQEKIARQLGISRSAISMILTEARDSGIVEIDIKNPQTNNDELSQQMIDTFHLVKCFVIPVNAKLQPILTKIVASQGAAIVDEEIESHTSLGVAWGTTCYECMSAYRNNNNHCDVNVIPLIGGTNRIASEYQLNEMVRMMAKKLQGLPHMMFALAIAETIEDKTLYLKSATMQPVLEKWKSLDAALISVGAPPEYYNSKFQISSEEALREFETDLSRTVGDICARRFNIKGDFLDNEYNQRIIGVEEADLRKTKKVICVAAGDHKVLSMLGALRTNIIDIMITDENTASRVLQVQEMARF